MTETKLATGKKEFLIFGEFVTEIKFVTFQFGARGLVSFLDHFLSEAGFAPDMAINKAERNMIVQTAAYKAFLSGYFGCLKGVVLKFTSTLSGKN